MVSQRTVGNKRINGQINLRYYWSLVKSKVILGLGLMVAVKAMIIWKSGWLVALDISGGYDWLLAVFIFCLIGFKLSRQKDFRHSQVCLTGALAGLSLGLIIALIDLALFRNLWAVENLLRKPFLFMVMGMASTLIIFLYKHKIENNH